MNLDNVDGSIIDSSIDVSPFHSTIIDNSVDDSSLSLINENMDRYSQSQKSLNNSVVNDFQQSTSTVEIPTPVEVTLDSSASLIMPMNNDTHMSYYEALPSAKKIERPNKLKSYEAEKEFVNNMKSNKKNNNIQIPAKTEIVEEEEETVEESNEIKKDEINEEAMKKIIEEKNSIILGLQNKNVDLQNKYEQEMEENKRLDEKLSKVNQELNNYKYNSIYQNTNEVKKLKEENERLKDDYNSLKEQYDKINTQNIITQKQIESVQKSQIAINNNNSQNYYSQMIKLNQENSELKDQIIELKNNNQEKQFTINELEMKLNSLKIKFEELKSQRITNGNENEMLLKRDEYIKPSTFTSASSSSYTSSSNQLQPTNNYDNEITINEILNSYKEMKYKFNLFQQQHQQSYIPSNAERFMNKTTLPQTSYGYNSDIDKNENDEDDDNLTYINTDIFEDDDSESSDEYNISTKNKNRHFNNDKNDKNHHHHKHKHIHRYDNIKEKKPQIKIIHIEHPVPSVKELNNDLENPYIFPYELRNNQLTSPIKPHFYSNSISNNTLDIQYERVKNLLTKYDKVYNLKKKH